MSNGVFIGEFSQHGEKKKKVQKVQICYFGKNGPKFFHIMKKKNPKIATFKGQIITSHQIIVGILKFSPSPITSC